MKVEVTKCSGGYKEVKLREPTVADMIAAERAAGTTEGMKYMLSLLAQVGTYDGKKRVVEDLESMSLSDFFDISQALMSGGLQDLGKQLSSYAGKEG